MFFSEEKNQKTFTSALAARSRPWPRPWERLRDKSLLVLFFRKEHSFFCFLVFLCAAAPRDPALWPFAIDSPWNTPIGSGAVFSAEDSAETRDLLAGHAIIHAGSWSLPIYVAGANDPWVRVHDEENDRDFRAQVPRAAKPDPMGDAHLLVVEPSHLFALEIYRARMMRDRVILARRAFRVSLTGPGMFLRDGKFPGVRAMDASGMGGVLRAWELREGRIRHALTFALPYARLKHGPVWPSSREDYWGFKDYTGHVPIGTLIAMPPGVDVAALGLTASGMALARALQDYGAYCDDSVGTDGIEISAEGASEGMPQLADARKDFPVIRRYLRVVMNNAPATAGGGGVPRQPLAPGVR
jgi:hypothetical protein